MEIDTDQLRKSDLDYLVHGKWNLKAEAQAKVWADAQGVVMTDTDGQRYTDAVSGLYNVFVGHGRRELAQVAAEQMSQVEFMNAETGHTNIPAIRLAEQICKTVQAAGFPHLQGVFLCCGGAEANEIAYHAALWYWSMKQQPRRCRFLSFEKAYHGSTFLNSSAGDFAPSFTWNALIGRLLGSPDAVKQLFVRVPVPTPKFDQSGLRPGESPADCCIRMLDEVIIREGPDTFAAMIIEPIQGDGGCNVFPAEFLSGVARVLKKHGILLIADEVLTGFGKTGKWLALAHYPGVVPDMVTFAKAVSSGYLPVGGVIFSQEIRQMMAASPEDCLFKHSYTYSAHPACCAVALKNLEIIEREGLVQRADRLGAVMRQLCDRHLRGRNNKVIDIRGKGLLWGVEFSEPIASKVLSIAKQDHKILLLTNRTGDVLHLCPSAVVTEAQLEQIVLAVQASIDKATSVSERVADAVKSTASKIKEGAELLAR